MLEFRKSELLGPVLEDLRKSYVNPRYADVDARGGILEPPGIVEVKYRAPQQIEAWPGLCFRVLLLPS